MVGWLDGWMVDGWMVGWWMVGWLDGCAGIHDFGSCGPWIVLLCVNSNALQESPFFPTADPLCANKQHPLQLVRLPRSEEHTSELQSPDHIVCRLLLEKKKN